MSPKPLKLLLSLIFLFVFNSSIVSADDFKNGLKVAEKEGYLVKNPCEDSKGRDNYYSVSQKNEAYNFGLKIQQAVENEDVKAIFQLVSGELSNGPRKKNVSGKSFDALFTTGWKEAILGEKPSCYPNGTRGFVLGGDLVRYDKGKAGEWSIHTISGVHITDFTRPTEPSWIYGNDLLRPTCFEDIWASGDNYEFYHKYYGGSSAYPEFVRNIGSYMGAKIPLEPVTADWGDKLSLAVELNKCSTPYSSHGKPIKIDKSDTTITIEINDNAVRETCSSDTYGCKTNWGWYAVLRNIPLEACGLLAPHLKGDCVDIRLVKKAPTFGGGYSTANIYGIVKDAISKRTYMVPLANLGKVNDALNYLDELMAGLSTQGSDSGIQKSGSVEPTEDCSAWTSQKIAADFIQENLTVEKSPEKISAKMKYFKILADQIPNNCLMDFTDSVQDRNDKLATQSINQQCAIQHSLVALLNASRINYIRTIMDHDCLFGITFMPPAFEGRPEFIEPFWIDKKWVWRNRSTGKLLIFPGQKDCRYPQPFGLPCVGDKPPVPYAKGRVFPWKPWRPTDVSQPKESNKTTSSQLIQQAFKSYRNKDYRKALEILEPLAEQGHTEAQYKLGYMYEYGEGVPQNDKEADKWYRLSEE
jgi:hypothetical protein